MTLMLDLSPELEQRLKQEAAKAGLPEAQYALKTLEDGLGRDGAKALHQLFATWAEEDATDDPAEIEVRRRSLEEFKAAMNENRSSERKLYP